MNPGLCTVVTSGTEPRVFTVNGKGPHRYCGLGRGPHVRE
jgi:hypothetical protein